MLNLVALVGNLAADPEPVTTSTGTAVTRIRIAVNRRGSEDADFIEVTTFGKLAETCQQYLKKGRQVAIKGRLQQDSWTDEKTGEKRGRLEVIANEVSFGSNKPGEKATVLETDDATTPSDEPF